MSASLPPGSTDIVLTSEGGFVLTAEDGTVLTAGASVPVSSLPITPGMFVTFIALSSNASMTGLVNSFDPVTGILIFTVSTMAVALEIRRDRFGTGQRNDTGYVNFFDYGNIDDWGPIISLSIGNGITIVDVGVLQVYVPESQMRGLNGRTHIVAAVLTTADGVDARQLFLGKLPVLDGYMTT